MSEHEDVSRLGDDEDHLAISFGIYNVVAVAIFALMSAQFLFPQNRVLPIDRRTTSALCATLVFATRRFLFKDTEVSIATLVDWGEFSFQQSVTLRSHTTLTRTRTQMSCCCFRQSWS